MTVPIDHQQKKPIVLKEGKFIRLLTRFGWEYVERNNCSGIVIILAMTDEKKVILTEQYRIPVGRKVIEFPAGLVNDLNFKRQESLKTAAQREFLEETGYWAKKMIKMIDGPVSGGFTSDIVTLFKAEGIIRKHKGGGDHTELITVHEIPLEKVDAWLIKKRKKGCLVDPKIYTGLYFLKKYNEKY